MNRQKLSELYATGLGLEIGAYHNPFPMNPNITNMIYVDKWPYEKLIEMRDQDSSLGSHIPIARVDIVDDGETLKKIKSESVDFLVSSHQLEHCFSPLNAIEHHLRVVKPGGYVIYAVPEMTQTFDRNREITTLTHVIQDYENIENLEYCVEEMRKHFKEYLTVVDHLQEFEADARIEAMIKNNEDVHFHCWDASALWTLFEWGTYYLKYPNQVELFQFVNHEVFIVLRKKA